MVIIEKKSHSFYLKLMFFFKQIKFLNLAFYEVEKRKIYKDD